MSDKENAPDIGTDRAFRKNEDKSLAEMKEEVHRMSRELGISVEEAERSLYGTYGVEPSTEQRIISNLGEIREGMRGLTLKARLITVHSGTMKDGESEYHYGLLGDSVNTVRFSAWSKFDFSPGDGLLVQNATSREFRGSLEIVMNDQTRISTIDDLSGLLPIVEDGISGTIGELFPGMKRIDIECRVIELISTEISVKDEDRKEIMRGMIADRSGRMDITCWDPLPLEEGRCYRILGGYVKEFRGVQRLNLDAGAVVKEISDDRLPSVEELNAPKDNRIIDLLERTTSGEIKLRGTIVDVRSGSGIFKRCEECGRKLVKSQCTVHGKRKGEEDMSIRAVFDDGSGTCMLKGDRIIVESLLKRPMETVSDEVRTTMDPDMISDELSSLLIARPWTVTGTSIRDDYGLNLSLSGIEPGWDIENMKNEVSLILEVIL